MKLQLRKFAKFVDKTFIEGGKEAKEPVLLVSVAAVIQNPWVGKGFVEDIKPEIQKGLTNTSVWKLIHKPIVLFF